MKWIKQYRKFFEADDVSPAVVDPNVPQEAENTNKDAIKYLSQEMQDFKAKKSIIEALFKDKNEDVDNKIDLPGELKKKVYQNKKFPTERNRFLQKYEELLNIERSVVMMQKAVEKDLTNITDRESKLRDVKTRQSDISNTSLPSTSDNKQIGDELSNQEKILTDELRKLRTNVQKSKASLNKMKQTDIIKAQERFKEFMNGEQSRMKGLK